MGDAEGEAVRMPRRQRKDRVQAVGRRVGRHGPPRDQPVLGERRFHVHGKTRLRQPVEHVGQHVGAHAVGVDLDGRTERGELGRERGQSGDQGRLAAGDDEAVEPFGVGGGKPAHRRRGQGRLGLAAPGQGRVVAVRTAQVAAAEKKHGA